VDPPQERKDRATNCGEQVLFDDVNKGTQHRPKKKGKEEGGPRVGIIKTINPFGLRGKHLKLAWGWELQRGGDG